MRWVADGAVWLYLAFLVASWRSRVLAGEVEPEHMLGSIRRIPLLVVGIVLVKGAAAVAGFRATACQGLMSWRNIVARSESVVCLTGCGVALAVLALPASALPLSRPILALCVATLVPLARFPLATLALDWNRHR